MPATLTVAVSDATLAALWQAATEAGTTPEQVAASRLAAAVLPPPGSRPKRTPEEIQAALDSIARVNAFREQLAAKYGVMPDSTLDIAADRRRDD